MSKRLPLLTLLLISPLIAACASKGEITTFNELRDAVKHAQESADSAMEQALAAQMKANEAYDLALQLQLDPASLADITSRNIAEKAIKTANEAKEIANEANERAKRMYKKAVSR